MRTYREELTGQVRGNARLRRRIGVANARIKPLEQAIGRLVSICDTVGLGDHPAVAQAATLIGWSRDEETARKYREATK